MKNNIIDKLQDFYIRSYFVEGIPKDISFSGALTWRKRLATQLFLDVVERKITEQQFLDLAGSLIVQRQIEEEIQIYKDQLEENAQLLQDGEITQNEFQDRLEELVYAVMLLMFLNGRQPGSQNLTEMQQDIEQTLLDAAYLVLIGSFDIEDWDYINDQQNLDMVMTREEQDVINEQVDLAQDSDFGKELTAGLFLTGGRSLAERVVIWVNVASSIYEMGRTYDKNDPFLKWVRDPVKMSCGDCIRLNGQVHRASAWKSSGWFPRSNGLECKGFRCGCRYIQTREQQEVGSF